MTIKIEVRLKAGIKHDEQAQVWITFAPALGIYSQGENIIQAKIAPEDAIQSFLLVACKNQVLEKCLRHAGFSVVDPSSARPCAPTGEYIEIREARILEEKKFSDIFDIPASIALSAA